MPKKSAAVPTSSTTVEESQEVTLLTPTEDMMYANPLPIPSRIEADRPGAYVIQMRQEEQWLGLVDEDGNQLLTTIWGFGLPGQTATYPGPTILATSGTAIKLNWQNMLPDDGHLLPIDETVHVAELLRNGLEDGLIPTVVHLHGGHSEAGSDGLPEAWFTQHGAQRGEGFATKVVTYENDQVAATLWYHDHALGITRLNVYAGLAGFYLLTDDTETGLVAAGVLPSGNFSIEMAVQDRAFTEDGQLYYPAIPGDPLPGGQGEVEAFTDPETGEVISPTILPEFFGDFILVNGMVWPQLDVEQAVYRFRLLNGSDSRFYVLELDDPNVAVTLVGTDGGLLPEAITISDGDGVREADEWMVFAPGDRLDIVVDFRNSEAGDSVTLLNLGPAYEPFRGLEEDGSLEEGAESAAGYPVGEIMRFDVRDGPEIANATVTGGTVLNAEFEWLADPTRVEDPLLVTPDNVRGVGLYELEDVYGRVMPLLGTVVDSADNSQDAFEAFSFDDPVTEIVRLGDTEVWRIFNFTEDAHPIHLHLVRFQVVQRNEIEAPDEDGDMMPDHVDLGDRLPVAPEDRGWQDTIWVGPGQSVDIVAEFDLPGEYVWHCHILSHEDHEMMRPILVTDAVV